MQFLRDSNNKTELFQFLTEKVPQYSFPAAKHVYILLTTTLPPMFCFSNIYFNFKGQAVIRKGDGTKIPSCNHEEADTRIVVHLYHSLETCDKTLVRTVVTDVVVILIGKFADLYAINSAADIWVAFGMGRSFRFLIINAMTASLGSGRSHSLPFFHALTGSDTTSTFHGKGKCSAWQAWDLCADTTTAAMEYLVNKPFHQFSKDSVYFSAIERMIVIMYDNTSPRTSVNEARMDLFCHCTGAIDNLPPTQVIF